MFHLKNKYGLWILRRGDLWDRLLLLRRWQRTVPFLIQLPRAFLSGTHCTYISDMRNHFFYENFSTPSECGFDFVGQFLRCTSSYETTFFRFCQYRWYAAYICSIYRVFHEICKSELSRKFIQKHGETWAWLDSVAGTMRFLPAVNLAQGVCFCAISFVIFCEPKIPTKHNDMDSSRENPGGPANVGAGLCTLTRLSGMSLSHTLARQ